MKTDFFSKVEKSLLRTGNTRWARAVFTGGVALTGVYRGLIRPPALQAGVLTDYSKPEPRYIEPGHLLVEACSDPRASVEVNQAFHAACKEVAGQIIAAVPKWKKTMSSLREQGVDWAQADIAPHLSEEMALRAAAMESDMGRLERVPGTYQGLYQFSRTNRDALLFRQLPFMLEILNAARKDIPVLSRLKGRQITQEDLFYDEVFFDREVQVYLKMTSAYLFDREYATNPHYMKLTPAEKIAFSYFGHLLPVSLGFVLLHHDCGEAVNTFKYKLKGKTRKIAAENFQQNSGIFQRQGRATAHNMETRFFALTDEHLRRFAPSIKCTPPPHSEPPSVESFIKSLSHRLFGTEEQESADPSASQASLVLEVGAKKPLYDYASHEMRPPASTTKIMGLYVIFEEIKAGRLKETDILKISKNADSLNKDETRLNVPSHEMTVHDGILALITASADNVAKAFAERISGSEDNFTKRMKETAHKLGLSDKIVISSASGYYRKGYPDNQMSAADLGQLAIAIEHDFPELSRYFALPGFMYAPGGKDKPRYVRNHNHLVINYPAVFNGMKTGHLRSGYNIVATMKVGDKSFVIVDMGEKTWQARDQRVVQLARTYVPGFCEAAPKACANASSAKASPAAKKSSAGKSPPPKLPKARKGPLRQGSAKRHSAQRPSASKKSSRQPHKVAAH